MGQETCRRMLEQPSLLASRLLRLEATWGGLRTALHNCRNSIPGDWFAEMQLGLENALSCAYVNTYMMLLYVHERAGRDRMPDALPLAEVRACLKRETRAWERRDQANYQLMAGPAALDMLVEVEKATA